MADRSNARSGVPHMGEITIKVPAPFAGISDLGFTAQYRAQEFNAPLRDVPLLIEGPEPPMRRLAEMLVLLSGAQSSAYSWTEPVMLSDEVVVLAFRDRSVGRRQPPEKDVTLAKEEPISAGARIADYVTNLTQPVVFTFLRDCAMIARLRLSDVIEIRVTADRDSVADFTLPLQEIVPSNGERLLWAIA